MKKFCLAAGVVSSLFLAVNSAFAHDVVIDIGGEVTQATCDIVEAKDGQLNKSVELSKVSTNALSKVGDVAGIKAVLISLSGCTGTKVSANFNYRVEAVDTSSGAIINSLEKGSNVQVQLLDANYQPIKLGTNDKPDIVSKAGDSASVSFYAQYLAAYAPATAGHFQSQVMLDFSYE